jgi:endonuclease/exonuclease/phosphatase (EEP) superfamily protein YafD
VFIEETSSGLPTAMKFKQRHSILSIEDCWRIDDEWWRSEPVSRLYYAVILDSGRRVILYKNLIDKNWYRQT